MIPIPFVLQALFLVLVLGIALCLIFEAAGIKEGFRRQGTKTYISLVAGCVIFASFLIVFSADTGEKLGSLIFDSTAKSGILALNLLCASSFWILVERLKSENADRGELYAMLLCGFFFSVILCSSDDLRILSCAFVAAIATQVAILAMRKKRRSTPELALRLVISATFLLFLFCLTFIFDNATDPSPGSVIFIVALLFIMGSFPLQAFQVDSLDGSPSYSAVFLCGSNLITGLIVLHRLASKASFAVYAPRVSTSLIAIAAISLCVLPIMALDQRRIGRLIAYLLTSQAGIVLIMASQEFINSAMPSYLFGLTFAHFALCAAGTGAGLNFWKNNRHSFKTWEDFAGAGRQHPVEAGAFFIVLASICGLPFTSGFVVRNALLEASNSEYRLAILSLFWGSTLLASVPVFRLFAFFYGKNVRHELKKHHKPRRITLLVVCAGLLLLVSLAPLSTLRVMFDLR